MEMIVSFLSFMLLFNYLDGQPQFTTCPSGPLCLSRPVTYECNSGSNTLIWRVLDTNGVSVGGVAYSEFVDNVGDTESIGGQFITVLTVGGSSLVSNITFTPTLSISNYTVQCGDATGTFGNCSIIIADVPSVRIPGNITFYSDRLHFSWSPSTSPCLSHYNVNVTSIEYTINTTDTSLSLPVPSTNDTNYSISVVAVDTGGRYMDPVDERTFVPNVPESVTNLTLNQTGLSIDVSWDEPPVLMFLPLLSYIIYHNVPDPDTNITILAPTTTYSIPDATVGSVYTVGVAAVNVLGIDTADFASTTISTPGEFTNCPISICTPQFTICPSSVCLSQPVTYECNSGSNILIWRVLDTNGGSVGTESYTDFEDDVGATGSIGSQFDTVLTVDGSSLVSNITFNSTLNINNYIVQCGDASGTLMNCSIVIADIPVAPIPGSITFYSDRLHFSWSPSTSPCVSHYNVNVTSIECTINTTDTSLSLPVPSTNDTEYYISVVAVDTGGRYMDPVGERTFVADGK
ncbi:PREDICTED: uncharacterized protein LOC105313226 [Amphimedon queenslandica]|uniref:Fibronectin type-III domain-containing protein n=1 Tax=Amphimedon queenslandica TaxID=400682 RepID=A0AAN0J9C6_AMPQE|nr:PREDICTED: uncharacterized protein LOC105313226 [Amphimedon queenslandica]|eukprot:XP_019853645.1 PREDICTED: uncharacterized protein LOC105313226 [Amphimedon queenslandica]